MERTVALVALALATVPAVADLSVSVVPLDAGAVTVEPIDMGSAHGLRSGDHVYDNLWTAAGGPAPYTFNASVTNTKFMLDDLHMTGRTFTHVHYIYYLTGTGTFNQTVAFFTNPGGSSQSSTFGQTIDAFGVSGLPKGGTGGFVAITLTLPRSVVAPISSAIWMGVRSTVPTIAWTGGGFPQTDGGVGSSLPQLGTRLPLVFTEWPGTLHWAVGIPEPASIVVLALGGMAVLRRRA